MCTLIVLHRCVEGAPLVVAANRDEFLDRPAEGLALRPTAVGPAVTPLDRRAGGTWLGLNARGVFAALTNLRCAEPDPGRRSRGLLVIDALDAASAREAMEKAESSSVGAYNPFNLLVADRDRAFALTYGDSSRSVELGAGVHVIGNVAPDAPSPKIERQRKRAEGAATAPPEEVLDELARICRSHDGGSDPLEATCVHCGDYGTRSSTLLRLDGQSPGGILRHADGPPCRTDYRDFTPLLRELGRSSRFAGGDSIARNVS